VLLLLAPKGLPGRWLGLVLCLPLLYFPAARPAPDGFWFTLLDVGQGLAAVIRTHRHTLVYDTGPRLGARFDAGRAALLPYLRQQGLRRIDTLIVSHADSQHTGGVRSLLERVPVTKVLTSSPVEVPIKGAGSCRDGIEWWWDGVHFRLLHPPEDSRLFGNDASCVLWVAGEAGRVLLPGDIERTAEATLVARYGDQLSAQILVAPHHGHRDLSLSAFIDAVHPRYVLFSTGYKNRFGYPKPETVTRYSRNDAIIMDTAQHGAITFYVDGHPSELKPTSYRQLARRYWHTP
jgi:competence protein ComEC